MNADRIPHWVGRPIDWWHANTPVASMVESDRRIEAGEPPEVTALARTGLRVGAVVLCWLNMLDGRRVGFRFGVIDSTTTDHRWCWHVAGDLPDGYAGGGYEASELAVVPS